MNRYDSFQVIPFFSRHINCWDTINAGPTNSQPTVKPQVGFHLQDGETWWHKKKPSTQAIWLIWWFVFLIDGYILWVCICLLGYTLICIYLYTYMMSAFLSSGSWGTVGDVSCWCVAMSKGKTAWHGTVHCPQHTVLVHICNLYDWIDWTDCWICVSMFRFMWFIVIYLCLFVWSICLSCLFTSHFHILVWFIDTKISLLFVWLVHSFLREPIT